MVRIVDVLDHGLDSATASHVLSAQQGKQSLLKQSRELHLVGFCVVDEENPHAVAFFFFSRVAISLSSVHELGQKKPRPVRVFFFQAGAFPFFFFKSVFLFFVFWNTSESAAQSPTLPHPLFVLPACSPPLCPPCALTS